MKISEKQVWMLLEIAKNSLQIQDGGQVFVLTQEQRAKLVNEILNQLDNELIDIGELKENKNKLTFIPNEQSQEFYNRIQMMQTLDADPNI